MSKQTLLSVAPTVAELTLLDNEGEALPVKLKLQGIHIPSVKAKSLEATAWLQGAGRTEKTEEFVKAIGKAESAAAEMAAAAIIGWDNDDFMGGTYTPAYALELMKKPELEFVRSQVNTFVTNTQNFFRKRAALVESNTTSTT